MQQSFHGVHGRTTERLFWDEPDTHMLYQFDIREPERCRRRQSR